MKSALGQMRKKATVAWGIASMLGGLLTAGEIDYLQLDIIPYEAFVQKDPIAMETLERALYERGIVAISDIPGYTEKVSRFIDASRAFCNLPETVKESYAPNFEEGDMFLGYESGKERFMLPDGRWVIDDLKVSYYAYVPDATENKWPREVELQHPFEEIGELMSEMGRAVMRNVGLLYPNTPIELGNTHSLGRMLFYKKSADTNENPFWCGAHYDHGMFTTLLPATYFRDGELIEEPEEAGLFVRIGDTFKKVKANANLMLFQVGEFGQLAKNDEIKATKHRVDKADDRVERFTMAVFHDAPLDAVIHSHSVLTEDSRYGAAAGEPCTYRQWHEASFNRYIVTEEMLSQ